MWFLIVLSTTCLAFYSSSFSTAASTMATMISPPTDADADVLPRWDLNLRFGFESPNDPKIDRTCRVALVGLALSFARGACNDDTVTHLK